MDSIPSQQEEEERESYTGPTAITMAPEHYDLEDSCSMDKEGLLPPREEGTWAVLQPEPKASHSKVTIGSVLWNHSTRYFHVDEENGDVVMERIRDGSERVDPFGMLPNELVLRIFSYLSIRQIFLVSVTCKRFYSLSTETALWNEFAICRNWPTNQDAKFYRDLLIREAAERRRNTKKWREQTATIIISSRIWEFIFTLLLIYSCVATVLKFDSRINWSWLTILWPALLYVPYLWLILVMYGRVFHKYGPFEERIKARPHECYRPLFNMCCMSVCEGISRKRCQFFMSLASVTPFFPLLFLGLCGAVPSWIVPLPLHLVSVHLLLTPYYLRAKVLTWRMWKLAVWYLSPMYAAMWSTFLALLSAKLYNNTTVLWTIVVVPLVSIHIWPLFGMVILLGFLRSCTKLQNEADATAIIFFLGLALSGIFWNIGAYFGIKC
ncbi:hypothetical protein Pelo_10987 [Pelomyxa schiedti]|nr:hypothetical protein Pelo_10987 [Pelomyxa schiedti]